MTTTRAALALALSLALPSFSALAADIVLCESNDRDRHRCWVPDARERNIRLHRELSRSPCVRGDSWGVDDRGIWVDQGCRAEFWVGSDDRGRDRDRGNNRGNDRDWDREPGESSRETIASAIADSYRGQMSRREVEEAAQTIARACNRETRQRVQERGGRFARLESVDNVRRHRDAWALEARYELIFDDRSRSRRVSCVVDDRGEVRRFDID